MQEKLTKEEKEATIQNFCEHIEQDTKEVYAKKGLLNMDMEAEIRAQTIFTANQLRKAFGLSKEVI